MQQGQKWWQRSSSGSRKGRGGGLEAVTVEREAVVKKEAVVEKDRTSWLI